MRTRVYSARARPLRAWQIGLTLAAILIAYAMAGP